jgi:hypothetical protein
MVFRMFGDDRGDLSFQRLQNLSAAKLAPCIDVHLPQFVSILLMEYRHELLPFAIDG